MLSHDWECEKPFAAGNQYSSNYVINESSIGVDTAGTLRKEYGFEIIPNTPEVAAAGYTSTDRDNATVWYGPTSDGERFYYFASSRQSLNSILVCRKTMTGELVYSKDAGSSIRLAPAIEGGSLYATTNNSPVLNAFNKGDGTLRWSLNYYSTGNLAYSLRRATLNLVVYNGLILCGSSSIQNSDANKGIVDLNGPGGGFPQYADQGHLFLIRDNGNSGTVVSSYCTCPPVLTTGATLTAGGDPNLDPFIPGRTTTVIGTVSVDRPESMHQFSSAPTPGFPNGDLPPSPATELSSPIAATVAFDLNTTVDATLFKQPIWNTVATIYQDGDRNTAYTKQQLVDLWQQEQITKGAGRHVIWTFLSVADQNTVQNQPLNGGLYYYKNIKSGDVVANELDANALNYWGNSVWGAPPSVTSEGVAYFSTGQCHAMPFYEQYEYYLSPTSYNKLNDTVTAAVDRYLAGQETLSNVNASKKTYLDVLRQESVSLVRSPRGAMSLTNTVISYDLNTKSKIFAVRTMPLDVYTFVTKWPDNILTGMDNIADGDASSSVQLFYNQNRKKVAAATKLGLGVVIDVVDGVCTDSQYLGPPGILGGTNYQPTQDGQSTLLCFQLNTDQQKMVTKDGTLITQSFLCGYDIESNHVKYNTQLSGTGAIQAAGVNGIVLGSDSVGNLYALSMEDGTLLWRLDNAEQKKYPTTGGITGACVMGRYIIWIPQYTIRGLENWTGRAGKYGFALTTNKCNKLECGTSEYVCETFTATSGEIYSVQLWESKNKVKGKLRNGGLCTKYTLKVCDGNIVDNTCRGTLHLKFSNLRLFSKTSYQMTVSINSGPEVDLVFSNRH